MPDLHTLENNLTSRGYTVRRFATGAEAAAYLDSAIDGYTVGIGGSATIQALGLYDRLQGHNTVYWHWTQAPDEAREKAMTAQVYLTSANAVAETGELINIDGKGNRVSATLFGHEKVYFVIGRNKVCATYDDAVWRARNIAAPARARQLGSQTPCAAAQESRCFDCRSPERVCRGMVTLWGPMLGMAAEVVLIDEDLGL